MIKIEVCLDSERVRDYCIANHCYTLGNNSSYTHLLYDICDDCWYDVKSEAFEEQVKKIAEDIAYHSNEYASHEEMVEHIISGLMRANMVISVK